MTVAYVDAHSALSEPRWLRRARGEPHARTFVFAFFPGAIGLSLVVP
jgi:hypothetical protein